MEVKKVTKTILKTMPRATREAAPDATLSNYEITRNQMRTVFTAYDQDKIIRKFSLESDADYIYLEFIRRNYRIGRQNGIVEWSDDGFATTAEADFNECMTIYEVLCDSKDDLHLSGKYLPVHSLNKNVCMSGVGADFFQKNADAMNGRTGDLIRACRALGEVTDMVGDVSAVLYPFSFLPVTLQFWEADDEFPASLKIMFDENTLDYMRFETTFYMVSHLLKRIEEIMDSDICRKD